MKHAINIASTALSSLVVVLLALAAGLAIYLDGRAQWSGGPAPEAWSAQALADDVFAIPGREIVYWGDPHAVYSKYATRKRRAPVAIVVHFTTAKPVQNLVSYGHMSDPNRGGASFGYHFYIGRDGVIVQGAPLSRRTNHIKFSSHAQRRAGARHLWSGNTIAVSLVGGCDALMRPRFGDWAACSDEFQTPVQIEAGLALIQALQEKFGLKCDEVYGHGDLQYDRESFEGLELSRLARDACGRAAVPDPEPTAPPVEARDGGEDALSIAGKPGAADGS